MEVCLMPNHARPLTTGEVADYCGVSRMGVLHWIRQGKLKAYTTPGGHYRIRFADFYDFLQEFDIPIDTSVFDGKTKRILVVAKDTPTLGTIVRALSAMPERYEIDVAADDTSAINRIADFKPALVIVDTPPSKFDNPKLARWVKDHMGKANTPILLLITPGSRESEALQSTVRRLVGAQAQLEEVNQWQNQRS
jgi:two-component system OmpR family response regulator